METHFDAIVIGSGIGGLAAASLLARVGGKRVLVLERHFKPGGFTHTFQRRAWSFDVGLHYVGELQEWSQPRRLLDLASGGALAWTKLPSRFERFVYPELTFEVPDDPARYREALAEAFPAERDGVRRWFDAIESAAGWAGRHFVGKALPRPAAALAELPGRAAALRTTGEVLGETFRDPLLRAVAASQWADYGLPPSRSAFAMHAVVARSYLRGAWYPAGGAGEIARTFLAQVEAAGGECRVNHEALEILVERGRAAGVRASARRGGRDDELTFHAPLVVSDAGAAATYGRLLPGTSTPPSASPRLGTSHVSVYLGLSRSPAELGFRGENNWFFELTDHDAAFAGGTRELLRSRALSAYLSFPSLKDPRARAHTAELVAVADAAPFARWRALPWRRRGEEYERVKARIAEALLGLVERHHPGFRELVAYQEVSTPLTVEHFTAHPGGRIYGAPATPERMRDPRLGVRTPVKGLYLAGADAMSLGIMGAFMGGVLAAGAALGPLGVQKVFAAAHRAAQTATPDPGAGVAAA
jgi:phytoene dehydrogenase-like protein